MLEVHPLLLPRAYVAATVTADGDAIELSIGSCPALDEVDGLTWPALVVEHDDKPLRAIAQAILPTAQVQRLDPMAEHATWRITDDPSAEPATQPDEVTLAEFSTGADFHFARRATTSAG